MKNCKAFTLIELMVVIGIIALLVTLLMPTFTQTKELASRTVCLTRINRVAKACLQYAEDWNGYLAEQDDEPSNSYPYELGKYIGQDVAWMLNNGLRDKAFCYRNGGCPSYKKHTNSMAIQEQSTSGGGGLSISVNTDFTAYNKKLGSQGVGNDPSKCKWHKLTTAPEPARACISYDGYSTGPTRQTFMRTCDGLPAPGALGAGNNVLPRHLREGLNFVFLDTHGMFLQRRKDPNNKVNGLDNDHPFKEDYSTYPSVPLTELPN